MSWYLAVLKKYAVFQGRSRRKEYWMFTLVNMLIGFAIGLITGFFGQSAAIGLSVLCVLYSLFVLIPGLAVSVRRLHDTGRSGWWLWIALIPLVGGLVLLFFMVQDGEYGVNEYGPNPKAVAAA